MTNIPEPFADLDPCGERVIWIPSGVVRYVRECADMEADEAARDFGYRLAAALECYLDRNEVVVMEVLNR